MLKFPKLPQFVKCTLSSISSAFVDFAFFYLIQTLCVKLDFSQSISIVCATVVARIFSTIVNFIINKFWCFESKKSAQREAILFAILFIAKMAASASLVAAICSLAFVKLKTVTIKIMVDTVLFFISFLVQKFFIFWNKKMPAAKTILLKFVHNGILTIQNKNTSWWW